MEAKERDEAAGGIGQQHADVLLARRHLRHAAAQDEAAHHQLVEARGRPVDILQHLVPAAMDVAGIEQGIEQRAVDVGRTEDHIGHHVIELVGLVAAQLRPTQSIGILELDRRQEGDGDLGEPAQPQLAPHAREGGVERTVDADREDTGLGHLGNGAGAFIDLHQRACHGKAAFGEDHHLAALLQLVHQHPERHGIGRVERDHVEQERGWLRPPFLHDMGIDGKAGAFRQEGREQRSIEEGRVVGDDYCLAARGAEILQALHLHPVEQAEEQSRDAGNEFRR